MRSFAKRPALLFLLAAFAATPHLVATTLQHMNLGELCQRADKIFRGTILDISTGTVKAGGGEIPTVTYRVRVDEAFKGTFPTIKDQEVVDIQMIGKIKPARSGDAKRLPVLPEVPILAIGGDYLLFTTAPSSVGLSTTVGLGQGCFHLSGKEGRKHAVNEFENLGLFTGMMAGSLPTRGPVPYTKLADQIRAHLDVP